MSRRCSARGGGTYFPSEAAQRQTTVYGIDYGGHKVFLIVEHVRNGLTVFGRSHTLNQSIEEAG